MWKRKDELRKEVDGSGGESDWVEDAAARNRKEVRLDIRTWKNEKYDIAFEEKKKGDRSCVPCL